ncbi:MAG: heparinase II/III family protein [Kiritimatiellia bacterium]
MKHGIALVVLLLLRQSVFATAPVEQVMENASKLPHPRLFAFTEDFERARELVSQEGTPNAYAAKRMFARAEDLLDKPVLTRVQTGRRLLAVSRRALYRISHLAMAYRLTGERKYLERGERELKAVCSFPDWNPSHFLDVGEMALAVSIGYDWFYDGLSDASRMEIAEALYRLGLQTGLEPLPWKKMTNNWGQVCRGGLIAASLALCDLYPEEAATLLEESVTGLARSMEVLAPNGCYPEGPGYWNYGMSYNVYGIAMLERACGTDFGLCEKPGFKASAFYPVMVTGPSGRTVGVSDSSDKRSENTVLWWFAKRFAMPDVIGEKEFFAIRVPPEKGKEGWLPPLEVLWADPGIGRPRGDGLPLVWNPGGTVPLVIQRSSWKKDATFFCFKAGSPSSPHGHLDGGNFIFETGGLRWAHELGCEEYNRLEQLGIDLWKMESSSTRWSVYRLNSEGHSVPSVDGMVQYSKGVAKVVEVVDETSAGKGSSVLLDLSTLYPVATSVTRRGILSDDGKHYLIVDRFEGLKPGAVVKWQMITRAVGRGDETDANTLLLHEKGKSLAVRILSQTSQGWNIAPAEGTKPLNTENGGAKVLSFTATATAEGSAELVVAFFDPDIGELPEEKWRSVLENRHFGVL